MNRRDFESSLGFPLDPFQSEALDAIDRRESVLVSAPTGSGKTVVARYAARWALAQGMRCFYTAPVKALSNQKHRDFAAEHPGMPVGLLTGDRSIEPAARIVVMTTEVLRNMLYAEPERAAGAGVVVLDEVHFLQDPYRGGVWEEVICNTQPGTLLVCLSATVSNAAELAAWIGRVHGPTACVRATVRPVELETLVVSTERSSARTALQPVVNERPAGRAGPRLAAHRRRRTRTTELVGTLAQATMLPAITFVFSRAGCDAAVRHCLDDGIRLTGAGERARIRRIAERATQELTDAELSTLGYGPWLAGLEAGVAAHHAGLVTPFREAVEECFVAALVKVVFATETLALGINMPARTVVVERMSKRTDHGHRALSASEFAQAAGRAGRRGIDVEGYVCVCWSPELDLELVSAYATTQEFVVRSAFTPTYNTCVNLAARRTWDQARALVAGSFAAHQGGGALLTQLERRAELLAASGCLEGFPDRWRPTARGMRLAGLYHECDLLVLDCLDAGVVDGLEPAEAAGVLSAFVFEPRGGPVRHARRGVRGAFGARGPRAVPTHAGRSGAPGAGTPREAPMMMARITAIDEACRELNAREASAGLPLTRNPSPGFAVVAERWARGAKLEEALARGELQAGDFVRTTRQLIDLLRQAAEVCAGPAASACAEGARRLDRGIVAASVTGPRP